MTRNRLRDTARVATAIVGGALPDQLLAQDRTPPRISARPFVEGSAKVKVAGGFLVDADIAIDTQASLADGDLACLHFGASGGKSRL